MKNGFSSMSFEKISVLDSNLNKGILPLNIGQVGFRVKLANYYWSYDPFSTSILAKCLFQPLGGDISVVLTHF